MSTRLTRDLRRILSSPERFALYFTGVSLRPYQLPAVQAIIQSVLHRQGDTFILKFSRQSGKDEALAQVVTFLLATLHNSDASIISVSPTFRPQTENAMRRLETRLHKNYVARQLRFQRRSGYIFQVRDACCYYFSAEPSASVVGATASHLLIVNEAQDVQPTIYDKRFAPMAAAWNATRVFAGTAWTADSLLEREQRAAEIAQAKDHRQRVFIVDADEVSQHSATYARFVSAEVERMGRDHPLIKTQYFCETLESESGMFSPEMLSAISAQPSDRPSEPQANFGHIGDPSPRWPPLPSFAFLIDVAGQSEASPDPEAYTTLARDSTTLTVVSVEPGSPVAATGPDALSQGRVQRALAAPAIASPLGTRVAGADQSIPADPSPTHTGPTYHVIARYQPGEHQASAGYSADSCPRSPVYHVNDRYSWTGADHLAIFDQIKALASQYDPRHIVIDATGVGEGLFSMLNRAFHGLVLPVKFTPAKKSDIGWKFLSILGTGRFRDHCHTPQVAQQYARCRSQILPGPEKLLRWGVPDGARDILGQPIHDDHLMADALVTQLEDLDWPVSTETTIITALDPLPSMDRSF